MQINRILLNSLLPQVTWIEADLTGTLRKQARQHSIVHVDALGGQCKKEHKLHCFLFSRYWSDRLILIDRFIWSKWVKTMNNWLLSNRSWFFYCQPHKSKQLFERPIRKCMTSIFGRTHCVTLGSRATLCKGLTCDGARLWPQWNINLSDSNLVITFCQAL